MVVLCCGGATARSGGGGVFWYDGAVRQCIGALVRWSFGAVGLLYGVC